MGRNLELGDKGVIAFNLYGHTITNGKLTRDSIVKDRFYATVVETKTLTKSIASGVIRSNDVSIVVKTNSNIKIIAEDDYCMNLNSKEMYRIEKIEESVIVQENCMYSVRPSISRTLYLKK